MHNTVKKSNRSTWWQIFFVIFILFLPFQFALSPVEGIDLAVIRLIAMSVFGWWLIESFVRKECPLPPKWQMMSVVSFLLFAALSVVIAENTQWALRKYAFLLSLLPLYFVLTALIGQQRIKKRALIQAIVMSGTLVACIGIGQFLLQFIIGLDPSLDIWRISIAPLFLGAAFSESVIEFSSWLVNLSGYTVFRAIAFFPDPHIFAFFLELCLPWAAILFIRERKMIYAASLCIMLIAVALSFSRGAYIGLLFGTLVGLGYLLIKKNIFKNIRLTYAIPIIVAGIGIMLAMVLVDNPVKNRLISSFDIYEGSNEGRLYMWKEAHRISKENILLGVGIGNYPLEIKPSVEYREPIYAHNLYLDILVEMGIFSLLAWISWILLSIKAFLRESERNMLYLGGFFVLSIFSVHTFFDTPLFSVHIFPLLLVILALGMPYDEDMKKTMQNHG
jgi:O-antigen ligase